MNKMQCIFKGFYVSFTFVQQNNKQYKKKKNENHKYTCCFVFIEKKSQRIGKLLLNYVNVNECFIKT